MSLRSDVESKTFTIDCDKKHWLEIETCINIQSNGAICKLRIPFLIIKSRNSIFDLRSDQLDSKNK